MVDSCRGSRDGGWSRGGACGGCYRGSRGNGGGCGGGRRHYRAEACVEKKKTLSVWI